MKDIIGITLLLTIGLSIVYLIYDAIFGPKCPECGHSDVESLGEDRDKEIVFCFGCRNVWDLRDD